MIASGNALEACRMANYVAGTVLYDWQVVSLDGTATRASSGLSLQPTCDISQAAPADILFVCGGTDIRAALSRKLRDTLRRQARQGTALGALCTGAFPLAEAGLLDGYRCAIHWESLPAIREEFPHIDFVDDIFAIDRDRLTCTGGVAPLDMMLRLIESDHGPLLARAVSDQFILERIRSAGDLQHLPLNDTHPLLAKATQLMQQTIDSPRLVSDIARDIGVSARQLERVFKHHTGAGPNAAYLALRLSRARELLRQTALQVTSVGSACGFQSMSHFSAAYRARFGHPPSAERTI